MVATWLTELSLDRLNRALLDEHEGDDSQPSVAEALTEELRDFLRRHVDLLDPRTTINLLASYGRLDDLMHYASYRQVSQRSAATCNPQSNLIKYCVALLHSSFWYEHSHQKLLRQFSVC